MYRIIEATLLAPDVKRFRIEAPEIARKQRAGQFVIVRVHEQGERIPLTIASSDARTITLIVQGIGKTTRWLNRLETGDAIRDVVGPLGKPSEIHYYGTVAVIGGGVGTAIAYPTAQAFKFAGNRIVAILGARTKSLLILEAEMREFCDEVHVTTDDGSSGAKGLVTDALQAVIASDNPPGLVLAIGPIPMMRAVAETTRPHGLKTVVSLNPIMVDGTGMCGGCRVQVGGRSQFACVDGPEFDAHAVDFKLLAARNAMYREAEQRSLADFNAHPPELHHCRLTGTTPETTANLADAQPPP